VDADLASLCSLDDPVRLRLYEIVAASVEPAGRDEVAEAAGIGRALTAYHLDKLVEAGLLAVSYRRLTGRAGPGAGRPAKLYARPDREFAVSVPPRHYELAARLMAEAIDSDATGVSRATLREAAYRYGAALGSEGAADLPDVLTGQGYEPVTALDDVIRLRNCPFHQLVDRHREAVCGMNLAFIEGLVANARVAGRRPVLDPRPGFCCVSIGVERP
jgi:predicted ArsR family transcriptional regulator